MPDIGRASGGRRILAAAIGVSSVLWLAACGGSSTAARQVSGRQSSSTLSTRTASSMQTSAAASTSGGVSGGQSAAQAGEPRGGRHRRAHATSTSTATATRSAATQTLTSRTTTAAASRQVSPMRLRHALAKAAQSYAACLREHGVHVPSSHGSGNGPALNLQGVNTSSPQYARASARCRAVVAEALREAAGSQSSTRP